MRTRLPSPRARRTTPLSPEGRPGADADRCRRTGRADHGLARGGFDLRCPAGRRGRPGLSVVAGFRRVELQAVRPGLQKGDGPCRATPFTWSRRPVRPRPSIGGMRGSAFSTFMRGRTRATPSWTCPGSAWTSTAAANGPRSSPSPGAP
ncbi:MAG: hypothetical protein MZV64_13305 [Ignavibacteriales bacterium]|nr:hypothetical protein [Ignavibacteriales bacterium]